MQRMRRVDPKHYTKEYYLTDCTGYNEFKKSFGRILESRYKRIIAGIKIKKGIKVLDIGCGRGEIVFWAAKHGAKAFGIDYAKDAIALAKTSAKTYAKEIQKRVHFTVTDAKKTPFPNTSFDIIFFIEVVEHLYPEEQEKIIKEIHRVLKQNGILVMHTAPSKWFNDYTYRYYCYPLSRILIGAWNTITKKSYPHLLPWKLLRTDSHTVMHVSEPDYFSLNKLFKHAGFAGKITSTNITVLKPVLSWKDVAYNAIIYLHPLSTIFPFNVLWGNDFFAVFKKQ